MERPDRRFKYGVNVNFSDFLSKIDYMKDGEQNSGGKIKRAGVLFNEFYGYVCEGIYQTQEEVNNSARTSTTVTVGDLKYRDISGPDGVPDGVSVPNTTVYLWVTHCLVSSMVVALTLRTKALTSVLLSKASQAKFLPLYFYGTTFAW